MKAGTDLPTIRKTVISLVVAMWFGGLAQAQGVEDCGSLDNAYGPFDYTNQEHVREKLPIVESHHFTHEVEILAGHKKCGGNQCQLTGDIDYTLRAFPNHHRALMTMANYHVQRRLDRAKSMKRSARCYFDRALRFAPRDGNVHMIYGYYLFKIGKIDESVTSFADAVNIMPTSAEANYNLGLAYTTQEKFDLARVHARRAYELGYPLPGLRRKLERLGEWEQVLVEANNPSD